jgi:predicted Zn-dependent protease
MCGWGLPTVGAVNDLIEADVRFNITNYNFTIAPTTTGCSNKYDLVSVGTHEAGHVFGLGHVSEESYPLMTMSKNSEICNSSARTLGKGDMLGLEARY